MSRLFWLGLVAVTTLGVCASDAMAQRNAAAKMRGDTRGFWNQGQTGGSYYYSQPARTGEESARSFSYEPIGIRAGDMVVVDRDAVKMMKGRNVVGDAPKGLEFKVTKVINGWLGAVVEVNGKKLNGWIWNRNVTLKEKEPAAKQAPAATGQASGERRFSYEPSQSTSTYRSYARTREPWQYLKTDPRRNR